jgi:hypothetical protein
LQCEKIHATADLRALFMPRARGSQDDWRCFAQDLSISWRKTKLRKKTAHFQTPRCWTVVPVDFNGNYCPYHLSMTNE